MHQLWTRSQSLARARRIFLRRICINWIIFFLVHNNRDLATLCQPYKLCRYVFMKSSSNVAWFFSRTIAWNGSNKLKISNSISSIVESAFVECGTLAAVCIEAIRTFVTNVHVIFDYICVVQFYGDHSMCFCLKAALMTIPAMHGMAIVLLLLTASNSISHKFHVCQMFVYMHILSKHCGISAHSIA